MPIGGPLPRRLLTLLAAEDGGSVPVDTLIEAMWDGAPPPRAGASLHAYVSRLRQVLDVGSAETLTSTADRYALRLPRGSRDVDELDQLALSSETAAPSEIVRLADRALDLVRGTPFGDAGPRGDPRVAAVRARCEERIVTLAERRLAALVDLGQVDRAVAELRQHVRLHPLREHGWQLLVVALYRSGRQSEALSECRQLRTLLDLELGIRPGPAFRAVEVAVLRQDPRLLWNRSTLPHIHDSFVGRTAELKQLDKLLEHHQLVTLHGPGGVGKTRLVVEWARRRPDDVPVWFAGLKSASSHEAVVGAAARAVGARTAAHDPLAVLRDLLSDRAGVLVLDNAEHVLAPVVHLVEQLRRSSPAMRVVVTTRATLGVSGEAVLSLDPLPLDDGPDSAVELLRERIRAHRPAWTATAADRLDLLHLARALDGLPLALELAAARSRAQSLADLATGVDLIMTAPVPHGGVNGHDTLIAAIDWSLALLSDRQRRLVTGLWPFVAGFTADAVDDAFGGDNLPVLADLVAKSVLIADTDTTPTRFWLLETVRARCRQLDTDPATSRLAMARWVRSMACRTDAQMCDHRSAIAARRLRADLPNIESAFLHDVDTSPVDALRTVTEINCWWLRSGHGLTALQWLDRSLAAAPYAPAGLLAKAHLLQAVALVLTDSGRPADVTGKADTVERLAQGLPDGDPDADHVRGALPYLRALVATLDGNLVAGRRYAEECLLITERLGTTWLFATVQTTLATFDLLGGDTQASFARLEMALRLFRRIGMRWGLATASRVVATAYLSAGRPSEALCSAQTGLRHSLSDGDAITGLSGCVVVARALAAVGDPRTAAVLADGARDWARRSHQRWDGADAGTLGDLDELLAAALTVEERESARRRGASLDIDQLVELAVVPHPAVTPHWSDDDVRVPAGW